MTGRFRWAFPIRTAIVAAGFSAASPLAVAQAGAQDGPPELDEVVVTAERREVNLQDVPASATVLSAEALAAGGVDNVIDIQTVAPERGHQHLQPLDVHQHPRRRHRAVRADLESGRGLLHRRDVHPARTVHRAVVLRHRVRSKCCAVRRAR